MITIFNGRQLSLDGAQDAVYAQVSVALRDKIRFFNTGRNCNPFAVFMALALHADRDGWAWPGRDKLSQETGIKNAIGHSLKHLCDLRIEGHRVLECYRERRTDGQWARTLYRIFPDAWEGQNARWPERFNPQGDMYCWDPNVPSNTQPPPHNLPLDNPPLDYVPPKNNQVLEEDPTLKEEEPAPPAPPPDDEWPTDRPPTTGIEPKTVEQRKQGIARAAATFEQNQGKRAGVADPTKDGWANGPVSEWCVLSGKQYAEMSVGTRLKLADIFQEVGVITDSTPSQMADAIRRFPLEYDWWKEKVGFEWPGDGFCNRLGMLLTPNAPPEPVDLDKDGRDQRAIDLW